MQTETHLLAHLVTKVIGIYGGQAPIEIEVFIRRGTDAKASVHEEQLPPASRKGFPYVHPFPTNLSEANKVRLDNLAYWSTGRRRSKNYLINQALGHYLVLSKESQNSTRWPR
ncbi:hypothetical protein [Hymenobacter sp. PAMC 26628]|uniref:hypothetical protein n=1 Tax=Hymenobacter sp. PAMC 26628 TaxID=1484118 RepID=UPI0012FFC89E|nr:hypothetical protein [Hymenobacter sp. PAMC 26628]